MTVLNQERDKSSHKFLVPLGILGPSKLQRPRHYLEKRLDICDITISLLDLVTLCSALRLQSHDIISVRPRQLIFCKFANNGTSRHKTRQ